MDILSHMDKYAYEYAVQPRHGKAAVLLSGGLDSSIILHHLCKHYKHHEGDHENIIAYTLKFNTTEWSNAVSVAKYYNVVHKTHFLTPDEYLHELPRILADFDRPRYNVWPYWLMNMAEADGCTQVWIGEGADEVFGGYPDRGFLEGWAGQLTYVHPTYVTLAKMCGLDLHTPFIELRDNLDRYYCPPNKMRLREEYDGILPPEILLRPGSPPGFVEYDKFFGRPNAKAWLHEHVIKTWLEVHK